MVKKAAVLASRCLLGSGGALGLVQFVAHGFFSLIFVEIYCVIPTALS